VELGGPVPQHNIRRAWKQQGVVTKSTGRQWTKKKSTSSKSNANREKKDEPPKLETDLPASMNFQQLLERNLLTA